MTAIKPIYLRLLIISVLILAGVWASKLDLNQARAGTLTDVSATMDNSRFSYRGEVNGDFGASNIIDIIVDSALVDYVDSSDQDTDIIKVGDVLNFGTEASPTNRTIEEITDGDTIRVDASVTANDDFFLSERDDLTIVFTTNSYVDGDNEDAVLWDEGYFEVLVPAATSANADDLPDQGFFDFGSNTASTVACTNITGGGQGHLFSGTDYTALATANQTGYTEYTTGNGYDSSYWHSYRCNYEDGDADDVLQLVISDLVNPVPASAHDTGVADTYDIIVRHMNGTTEIDSTWIKIGAIEAVKISATVVPSLTFTITGVASSTSTCGYNTDVTTTPDSVPFGNIETATFVHAAQALAITTNAVDGATVTAVDNDQLGLNGGACAGDAYNAGADAYTCIWDANVATMTHIDSSGVAGEKDWANNTGATGFGFSLDDHDSDTNEDFYYNQAAGTFFARHFASTADSQDPQKLFDSDSHPTNGDDVYVCYRVNADALSAAGDYYNYIIYTATAQF